MEFVKRLEELVKDFTGYELVMRDEVARKNALRRNKSDQKTRDVDIKEGSVMSYQGKKAEIIALHGEVDRPVTATVRIMENDAEMRVKVCELSEMAAAMPVYVLPTTDKVRQFIMWKDEEGVVCGGIITTVNTEKNKLQVHWRQQDEGEGKSWMPSWQSKAGAVKSQGKCPKGWFAHQTMVQQSEVLLRVEMTAWLSITSRNDRLKITSRNYSLLEVLRGASNLRVIFRNYLEAGNLFLSAAAGAFVIKNHKNIQLGRLFDFSRQTLWTWYR